MTRSDPGHLAQANAVLPLDATTLIGLRTGPGGDTALIRQPDGAIHRLSPGDTAGRLTLLEVTGQTARVADSRGTVFDLTLPPVA